jgi:hypothetical protein
MRIDPTLSLLAVLTLAGCGSSSSSSSSGGSAAAWQQSLATLAGNPAPALAAQAPALPVVDARGLAAWNDMIARTWTPARTVIDPRLDAAIRTAVNGIGAGSVTAVRVKRLDIDTSAPLALVGAQSGTVGTIGIEVPRTPDAWRVLVDAEVGWNLGFTMILLDVTVEVADIKIAGAASLDLSNPSHPVVGPIGQPSVAFRLDVRSLSPIVGSIASTLTQILDPVIRGALLAVLPLAPTIAGPLVTQALPAGAWGTGGTPAAGVPGARALRGVADEVSDEIQRHHMPFFGNVLPAEFDTDGYGNGQPAHYFDHGDSVGWTGVYMAAEAMRHAIDGDPRAAAGIRRGMAGIEASLDVARQGDGLLARCAIPLSSPFAADLIGAGSYFVGTVNGVPCASIGDMSRDHYIAGIMGLAQVWLRVPALRADAARLVTRMVGYLERTDWLVIDPATGLPSRATPFAQAPGAMYSFRLAARTMDPARFGTLASDPWADITSILWMPVWSAGLEPQEQYYKFELGHDEMMTLVSLETEPARYRDHLRCLELYRAAIGHHDNAYFDAIYAYAASSQAPIMGPRVRNELERWTLRDRRCWPVDLRGDPTIDQTLYSSPMLPGGPELLARKPVPIERRPCNDFLWQRSPFDLTGWRDSQKQQYPGIDLVAPFWIGVAAGALPAR